MIKYLAILFIFTSSFAALNKKPTKDISTIRREVKNLSRKINSLEKSLALKNRTYLETVKKRQMVDLEAYKIKAEIKKSKDAVEKYKESLNKNYKALVVSSLDSHDMKSLLVKKMALRRIRVEKKEIENLEKNNQRLKDVFTSLVSEYRRVIKLEDQLLESIQGIEESKKAYVEKYVDEKENFEKYKSVSKKKKRSNKTSKHLGANFESPLQRHFAYETNGKGITFKTKIKEGVKASKNGKVVYIGTLANFGNVIMIDHGGDLRSIYLGDFDTGVKKDQPVKEGQVIANVKSQIRKDQFSKIYFEVRKKDKVQDTIKLVKNFKTRG